MKIVHICVTSPYTENWSYHENVLPFWHKELGNEVTVIARDSKYIGNDIVKCGCETKIIDNGIKLIRIHVHDGKINSWTKPKKKLLINVLANEKPDFIWVHGVLNFNLAYVVEYKKKYNRNVIIVADNHADNSNYGEDFLRKINLWFFKKRTKAIGKYVKTFYGVTPGRCLFLKEKIGVPEAKIKLSIQGGNPKEIDFDRKETIKVSFRNKYKIPIDSFVYCMGGKLTKEKKLFPLLDNFVKSHNSNIRLLVFGTIPSEDNQRFTSYLQKDSRIVFVGFLNPVEISELYLSSDLAVFPGRHSVLWEKALACGLPCLFEQKNGYEHLFSGGSIKINDIVKEPISIDFDEFGFSKEFEIMRRTAIATRNGYLYDEIAKKTIEENCD